MTFKVDLVVDGEKIASFDDSMFKHLKEILEETFDDSYDNNVQLNIVRVDENFNNIPDVGSDLKEILVTKYNFKSSEIEVNPDNIVLFNDPDEKWEVELSGDEDLEELAKFIYEQAKEEKMIAESYVEDAPGEYTIWSASDLVSSGEQIPLVKIKVMDDDIIVEPLSDKPFDKESAKTAQSAVDYGKSHGKSIKDILIRIDKSLNHSDPFFSVEFDRSITNNGYELLAAQALRTIRDDLKAVTSLKGVTEDTIVQKFAELTGVNYYTDKVIDGNFTVKLPDENNKLVEHTYSGKEQYDQILKLMSINPNDKFNYVEPKDNVYVQQLKDLAEDLIEKVNLKNDPDFYKVAQ